MKRLIVYADRCTGCRLCESTCALYNDAVNDLSHSRIRIVKRHSVGLAAPVVCHQCKKPPCLEACPVRAIEKGPDGVVRIDEELCIGCEACVTECPFGVMIAVSDKAVKCELCNGDPQCVKYCATEAIEFGDPETVVQQRRERSVRMVLEEREI